MSAAERPGAGAAAAEVAVGQGSKARSWLLGLLALGCIALQFPGSLAWSAAALLLWLLALALLEPRPLRRLWRPRFWLANLVVALLCGLFLGNADLHLAGVPLSREGLLAGLLMLVRGGLIFGLAAWAAGRLEQGGLGWLGRQGVRGRLAEAAGVAVRLLPELTARMQQAWAERPRAGRGRLAVLEDVAVAVLLQTAAVAEGVYSSPRTPSTTTLPSSGRPGESSR